jgi:vacuolar protein sorting-associated protein 45
MALPTAPPPTPPHLNLVALARAYVDRALSAVPGMKALLLDADTARAVSLAASQTDILGKEVYLVERLDGDGSAGDPLHHLQVRGASWRGRR